MTDSDSSDFEKVNFGKFSEADVDRVRLRVCEKFSAINAALFTSRDSTEKRKLIETTLQEFSYVFNQITTAYLQLRATYQAAGDLKGVVEQSIKEQVTAALKDLQPEMSAQGSRPSYADAAARSSKPEPHKVKVANGPTVVLPNTVSVVIGPKSAEVNKFDSVEATRKAVMSAVKPAEIDLKINRLVNTRNKSVRIIADRIDLDKLKASSSLAAAGLEVKEREKLNPRLVIRGVPVDTSSTDLQANIIALNLDGELSTDCIKIVYRYPPRANNNLASVVIETTPDVRKKLKSQGRIYLPWQSCKVEDHLRILQCFKCQSFGHLAKNCTSAAVCGNCAGAHETALCTDKTGKLKCKNCVVNKLPNSEHRAFDVSKCPIIKRRLTEKAKNISY